MISALFWISGFLFAYTYLIFPLLLWTLTRGKRGEAAQPTDAAPPFISIIIAAFNEARVIPDRIKNLLELNYPADRFEILIASDGSSDGTAAAARASGDSRVRVLDFPANRGRAAVHNDAASQARGEVLLFSDAETQFDRDFLKAAGPFLSDPAYGCGAGEFSFRPEGPFGKSEGGYWRFERTLRYYEHQLGILPFASGGCLFVRKDLYSPVPDHSDIDCRIPYAVANKGLKVFYAREAKAYDVTAHDRRSHYLKRVRTALKGLEGVVHALPGALSAGRWDTIWIFISHRILRWFGGGILILFAGTTAALFPRGGIYSSFGFLQCGGYLFAAMGWAAQLIGRRGIPGFQAAYGFLLTQAAFVHATYLWFIGRRITAYRPVSQERKEPTVVSG